MGGDDLTKQCSKCKETKLRADFYRRSAASDGLQSSCKACCAQYQQRPETREARNALQRARLERPEARDAVRASGRAHKARLRAADREGMNAKQRAWWSTLEADEKKRRAREYALQTRYGITHAQYEELFRSQGGRCWICGAQPGSRPLVVDHRHSDGLVRGLLCGTNSRRSCNVGLGIFKDNPEWLRRAALYLEEPPAPEVLGGT